MIIKIKNNFFLLLLLNIGVLFCKYYKVGDNVESIMGDFTIESQLMADVFNSYALNRMKYIDQGGPGVHFNLEPAFTRYDHCVGVCTLVKRFGASSEEQIVALLHDVSHTGFSHLADHFIRNGEIGHDKSFQDSIHISYLKCTDIVNIIEKYKLMAVEELDPDIGKYKMLEKPLPDMCADRIEYNLHTAFAYKILSLEEIKEILNDLRYENENWFFVNLESAKKFANLPIKFMYLIWNNPKNSCLYNFFCELLNYAISKNIITREEFIFGVDLVILNKIKSKSDEKIEAILRKCFNTPFEFKIVSPQEPYDKHFKYKFRGIDPLVKLDNGKLYKLSEIDQEFRKIYDDTKKYCQNGIYIKFNDLVLN